jgi:hypothetical protein
MEECAADKREWGNGIMREAGDTRDGTNPIHNTYVCNDLTFVVGERGESSSERHGKVTLALTRATAKLGVPTLRQPCVSRQEKTMPCLNKST